MIDHFRKLSSKRQRNPAAMAYAYQMGLVNSQILEQILQVRDMQFQ